MTPQEIEAAVAAAFPQRRFDRPDHARLRSRAAEARAVVAALSAEGWGPALQSQPALPGGPRRMPPPRYHRLSPASGCGLADYIAVEPGSAPAFYVVVSCVADVFTSVAEPVLAGAGSRVGGQPVPEAASRALQGMVLSWLPISEPWLSHPAGMTDIPAATVADCLFAWDEA